MIKDRCNIMYIPLLLPVLSRPCHHPYFSLLCVALLVFVLFLNLQNVFSLVMPAAFCKDSTVSQVFRVFVCFLLYCRLMSSLILQFVLLYFSYILFDLYYIRYFLVLFTFTSAPITFLLHFYYFFRPYIILLYIWVS